MKILGILIICVTVIIICTIAASSFLFNGRDPYDDCVYAYSMGEKYNLTTGQWDIMTQTQNDVSILKRGEKACNLILSLDFKN